LKSPTIHHPTFASKLEVPAESSQPMKQPYCVLLAFVDALSRSGWPCTKGNSSKNFRYNCNGLDR
jgi:hypothetical protein